MPKAISENLRVLLSFDVEEFDLPLEMGAKISEDDMFEISKIGTERLLNLLDDYNIEATFFSTTDFALHEKDIIRRIIDSGHELASHGCNHQQPSLDYFESKSILERSFDCLISGYRQPRMGNVDYIKLKKAGYKYDSSLHPTFMPGRYNHLKRPKTPFFQHGIMEIPVSVTPALRIPLFWLALQAYPMHVYKSLCKRALLNAELLVLYFHPWQFADLTLANVKIPAAIKYNSGDKLLTRLAELILFLKKYNAEFLTFSHFYEKAL
ncbi:MAG: polysaccharide deacetylase family protein [Muribaculaceae bacterium]|nr:polysaccharide deacetylase family protein [Muribaculaceae bacterium]